jgi:holo-[acyl-carrier protein] synthase
MPNIIGLGIDLTEIPRIVSTIERYGTRFLQRIFTEGEIAYCMRRREAAIHFAGRFASKEAAMKALGTGFRGLSFREIVVGREASGKPTLRFQGRAIRLAEKLGVESVELTITHTERTAAAAVLLVCGP